MQNWLRTDPRWDGVREEQLAVNGHPVRILRADHRAPAGAPAEPQLLVHGLGGSAVNWIDVLAGLAVLGPVVAVDLPGFGGTPIPDGGSARVTASASFVVAVARTLEWERYALHGNSMGGLVAALAAGQHPAEVSSLVLTSPALPPSNPAALLPPPRAALLNVIPMALPLIGPALVSKGLGVMEEGTGMDGTTLLELVFHDPSLVRDSLLNAMAVDAAVARLQPTEQRAGALVEATRSIATLWLDPRTAHDAIRSIEAPTLLIGGEHDRLVPARVVRSVGRMRPQWATWIAPDVGHVIALEQPDRYVEEVLRWRETVEADVVLDPDPRIDISSGASRASA